MKIIEQLRSAISHIDSWLAYNVDCRDRNISEFRDTHVSLANLRTISASFPALLDVAQASEAHEEARNAFDVPAMAAASERIAAALAALERQGLPITAESFCEAYAAVLDAEERR